MKTTGGTDDQKRRAGERAAEEVTDGDVVGLGTGSTAAHAIRAIGEAVESGLDVRGVPTSFDARRLAREAGIPLRSLDEIDGIDLAIDGADRIDRDGAAIKGGGGAHAREKVVDAAADRFVAVVDPSKVVATLSQPVPVAVLPDAYAAVTPRDGDRPELPALVRSSDLARWREALVNDFEAPIAAAHPAVARARGWLRDQGADYVSLTGSGGAVYGVFEARAAAERALQAGRDRDERVHLTPPRSRRATGGGS